MASRALLGIIQCCFHHTHASLALRVACRIYHLCICSAKVSMTLDDDSSNTMKDRGIRMQARWNLICGVTGLCDRETPSKCLSSPRGDDTRHEASLRGELFAAVGRDDENVPLMKPAARPASSRQRGQMISNSTKRTPPPSKQTATNQNIHKHRPVMNASSVNMLAKRNSHHKTCQSRATPHRAITDE